MFIQPFVMAENKVREGNIAENLSLLVEISTLRSSDKQCLPAPGTQMTHKGSTWKKISWVGLSVWLPLPLENNGILYKGFQLEP